MLYCKMRGDYEYIRSYYNGSWGYINYVLFNRNNNSTAYCRRR